MSDEQKANCGVGCPSCHRASSREGVEGWSDAHSAAAQTGVGGWSLLWRAAGVFLLPVAMALVGAVLAGETETQRFVGALIGLAGGMALCMICAAVAKQRAARSAPDAKEPQ